MVGSIYKVIAKLLCKRISFVMPSLIGETQSAFVKRRQILDGALIANEVVHWVRKKQSKSIRLKLDFRKAYDTVRWSFIDYVLEAMGFGSKWRKWISCCLSSTSMSITVNGSPCHPFKMHRSLRQGDPLFPFLFVLVIEVFNNMFQKQRSCSTFKTFELARRM